MMTSLAAVALSLTTSAATGTWALAPVEGVNLHPGHVAAAEKVLTGHLEALGQPLVLLAPGETDAAGAARAKGASAILRCTLTRLGRKVKVWMRLQPLDGAARTVTLDAGSPEDLDTVLLRLGRHLSSAEPAADARIGEVTEPEEEPYGRKTATSYVGVAVGMMGAGTASGGDVLGGLSAYWLYDARTFLADVQAGFGVSQGASESGGWSGVTIAGLYPLRDRDFTPFVGAGLGFLGLELDGRSGRGVQVFGDAGVLFGRTSTVHFRADLKPFITTFGLTGASRDKSIAYGAQASLGVGF